MAARQLRLMEDARLLALSVYRATSSFPEPERYGLVSQMRRASVSVGSNLAEGAERGSDRDFARFVGIALGSLAELRFQSQIATDLGLVDETWTKQLGLTDMRRQLVALLTHLSG